MTENPKKTLWLQDLRALLDTMRLPGQPPGVSRLLEVHISDVDATIRAIDEELRRTAEPVTFVYEVIGFILVGQGNDVRPVVDPGLVGLRFANEVFGHGEIAGHVVCTADWGMTPNAARNALKRAADWADRYCRQLARAILAIRIDNDGRPSIESALPIQVRVF